MIKKLLVNNKSKIGITLTVVLVMVIGFSSVAFAAAPPPPGTNPDVKPDGQFIETLADKLGMSVSDLRQELQDGKTVAELADETGISLDDLADTLMTSRQERLNQGVEDGKLTQEQADQALQNARDRLLNWMNTGQTPFLTRIAIFRYNELNIIAEKLDMSEDDLRQSLKDGKTVAQLAESQGFSLDDISAAVITPLEERLNQAVADGKMTQEQADQVLQKTQDNLTKWFETGERTTLVDRARNMVRSQLGDVAALLGMSEDELKQALEDGQTIDELAKAKDASLDEVASVMIAPLEERTTQAVSNGKLTQDQADTIIDKAKQRVIQNLENPDQSRPLDLYRKWQNNLPFGNGSRRAFPRGNMQDNSSFIGVAL